MSPITLYKASALVKGVVIAEVTKGCTQLQ